MRVLLTLKSTNKKTGPIPVSTTSAETCPSACPLQVACYAKQSNLGADWRALTSATSNTYKRPSGGTSHANDWDTFCVKIAALPLGQLWRHNQAGDLPGNGNAIDAAKLAQLVKANRGKRGFTYTHKPLTKRNAAAIRDANVGGFTVNLSADDLREADQLASLAIAPVVTLLPAEIHGNVKIETPAGRRVVVCPATYREDTSCSTCALCQVRDRKTIVGFPAHGAAKRKATTIALRRN